MVTAKDKQEQEQEAPSFSKEQLLNSKQFITTQKDVLHALLEDGKTYSIKDIKNILEGFSRKVVH